jgi:hypothetical protein
VFTDAMTVGQPPPIFVVYRAIYRHPSSRAFSE